MLDALCILAGFKRCQYQVADLGPLQHGHSDGNERQFCDRAEQDVAYRWFACRECLGRRRLSLLWDWQQWQGRTQWNPGVEQHLHVGVGKNHMAAIAFAKPLRLLVQLQALQTVIHHGWFGNQLQAGNAGLQVLVNLVGKAVGLGLRGLVTVMLVVQNIAHRQIGRCQHKWQHA